MKKLGIKPILTKIQEDGQLNLTVLQLTVKTFRLSNYVLKLVMQRKIMETRSFERKRTFWLRDLRKWYECNSSELFRAEINKVRTAVMIFNLC